MKRKQVIMINQASTTNAATATGTVDTLGYDYVEIDVITTTSNNTTNNPSVLKLGEGDTTSAYTNISGTVGDTDWTIPDAVTSGNWGVKFGVDLRNRKRHIQVSLSPVTTQSVTAIANLYKADESPTDATGAGVDALVEV